MHSHENPSRSILTVKTLLTLLALLGTAAPAHAYLDPGTGSFILQMVLAAIAGAAMTIKLYWQRLSVFFSKLTGQSSNKPGKQPDGDPNDDANSE